MTCCWSHLHAVMYVECCGRYLASPWTTVYNTITFNTAVFFDTGILRIPVYCVEPSDTTRDVWFWDVWWGCHGWWCWMLPNGRGQLTRWPSSDRKPRTHCSWRGVAPSPSNVRGQRSTSNGRKQTFINLQTIKNYVQKSTWNKDKRPQERQTTPLNSTRSLGPQVKTTQPQTLEWI